MWLWCVAQRICAICAYNVILIQLRWVCFLMLAGVAVVVAVVKLLMILGDRELLSDAIVWPRQQTAVRPVTKQAAQRSRRWSTHPSCSTQYFPSGPYSPPGYWRNRPCLSSSTKLRDTLRHCARSGKVPMNILSHKQYIRRFRWYHL